MLIALDEQPCTLPVTRAVHITCSFCCQEQQQQQQVLLVLSVSVTYSTLTLCRLHSLYSCIAVASYVCVMYELNSFISRIVIVVPVGSINNNNNNNTTFV